MMSQSKKSSRRSASADKPATATEASATASTGEQVIVAALPAEAMAASKVLQLGSSLSIREVGEFAGQFKAMLAAGATDVDANQLESIDTAGMQLLLAAAVAAQRRGLKLRLLNAQGVKIGAARSLGLTEHLVELTELVP